MEMIAGKTTREIYGAELMARLAGSREILVDLGTGDGRFVEQWTRQTGCFAIGIDACRENLRNASRHAPSNAIYLIANAETLPEELYGLATRVTINFPWGSLLDGLVMGQASLLKGVCGLLRPGAGLDVRLNGGALAEAGLSLEEGSSRVVHVLRDRGFVLARPVVMDREALRACPTTWAKRLAFGRDPRALLVRGRWPLLRHQVEAPDHSVAVELPAVTR
jgi:16S rRNA (adenine(1408)-N(1))-methyltransferase